MMTTRPRKYPLRLVAGIAACAFLATSVSLLPWQNRRLREGSYPTFGPEAIWLVDGQYRNYPYNNVHHDSSAYGPPPPPLKYLQFSAMFHTIELLGWDVGELMYLGCSPVLAGAEAELWREEAALRDSIYSQIKVFDHTPTAVFWTPGTEMQRVSTGHVLRVRMMWGPFTLALATLAAISLAFALAVVWCMRWCQDRIHVARRRKSLCPYCKYEIGPLPVCPECGNPITPV